MPLKRRAQSDDEVGQLLRGRLGRLEAADVCPDAELLAAYADGALSVEEVEGLEEHLTRCRTCRATLACLTPTEGDAVQDPAPSRWGTILDRRWMALAATLVVGGSLWALWRDAGPAGPALSVARSGEPTPAPPTTPVPPPGAFAERGVGGAAGGGRPAGAGGGGASAGAAADAAILTAPAMLPPPPQRSEMKAALRDSAKPTGERAAAADPQSSKLAQAGATTTAAASPAENRVADKPLAEASRPASPLPSEPAREARQAKAEDSREGLPGEPARARAERGDVPAPAASPSPVPVAAGALAAPRAAGGRAGAADAAATEYRRTEAALSLMVVEAEGRLRWRLADGGRRIESSSDGGATWNSSYRDAGIRLSSMSAPQIGVTWAAGDRGVVVRRASPGGWERVTRPADEDLVAITATSATTAQVTTRSGAVYVTADGGATWTLR